MSKRLRIGTRDSELALWQARTVKERLSEEGTKAELVPVKSTGDLVLDKPLYELGITGIFTKTLDVALLKGSIDLAVHSMKDVPTALPEGIVQAAVLKRANPLDILVHKGLDFLNEEGVVATGSLRRKAQWLNRYPLHEIVDLRGNVNTRMQKLRENPWNAAIFAAAGLERIGLLPETYTTLQWMLPAPAQGAMLVVCRESDTETRERISVLNDPESEACTAMEREFLRELEGGCTAPIGALATFGESGLRFRGGVFSLDGSLQVQIDREVALDKTKGFGKYCAREVLDSGGAAIMEEIRKSQAGWELTQYNAISVDLLPVRFKPEDSIVVFTSKHAVRACVLGRSDKGLTGASCLCVGDTTASLIQEHGGRVLESAPSATGLASLISKKYTEKSFIYYCGDRRLDILPEAFDKLQLDWKEVVVYRTKTEERAFNDTFEGILFFSPSGVESYTSSNPIGLATAYCIGPTTAQAVSNHTERFKIAESPGVEALVSLVIQQTTP